MQPQATQTPPRPEVAEVPKAPMPAPATSTPPAAATPAKTGYAKRPVWQWVLIYVVVAVIVYGLVYYLFIRKTGSGSTGGGY